MENTASPILEPVILNPVSLETSETETKKKAHPFLKTAGTMFLGWLVGNLIVVTAISLVVIYMIASTGLVRVPLLTAALFKKPASVSINAKDLASANKKINQISKLANGQSIPEMTFTENELNAYLSDSFAKNNTDIINPYLSINSGHFTFTGFLKSTGAPVIAEGDVNTSTGVFKIDFNRTMFGKTELPAQFTNGILSDAFAKIGFSLENSPIPARKVSISGDTVTLSGVSKIQ